MKSLLRVSYIFIKNRNEKRNRGGGRVHGPVHNNPIAPLHNLRPVLRLHRHLLRPTAYHQLQHKFYSGHLAVSERLPLSVYGSNYHIRVVSDLLHRKGNRHVHWLPIFSVALCSLFDSLADHWVCYVLGRALSEWELYWGHKRVCFCQVNSGVLLRVCKFGHSQETAEICQLVRLELCDKFVIQHLFVYFFDLDRLFKLFFYIKSFTNLIHILCLFPQFNIFKICLHILIKYFIQPVMNNKSGTTICCMVACITLLFLPFIICDYSFAHNDTSCAPLPLHKYSISFPLSTWLKVDGFLTILQMIGIIIIVVTVASETKENPNPLFYMVFLMMMLISLFNFIWLIIGAVMFWGELHPGGHCNSSLSAYMFARLILGFLSIALNLLSSRRA